MGDSTAHQSADQCQACPVCALLRAVHDVHPEVGVQLAAAGKHLVRAVRAFVAAGDTRPAESEGAWSDDRCGTTPDLSPPGDHAHEATGVSSLRRIAVD